MLKELHKAKSKINGIGLYSEKSYKKNELIGYIHGPVHVFRTFTPAISKRMLNWIGAGRYSWIETDDSPFRYINHSCDPNTAIITKRKVIAIKVIPTGTELTMDYSLTEAEPDWKIEDCHCGSENCRHTINPIQKLSKSTFSRNQKYIQEKFQKIYRVEKTK